tara:strand:+ start:751 stop:1431 length:681 start_codon:yes stop_codon:yes gene_type:complete
MSILGTPETSYVWKTRSVYFGAKRWSRGVTRIIRRLFVPDYRFGKLKRLRPSSGLPKRQAKRRGHGIDRALMQWSAGQSIGRCRIQEPRALITAFTDHGWVPAGAQVVVAWPAARIATRLDLVLYDSARHKVIVVEIKSGCLYRRESHARMRHVRPVVSNAPLHQHQLQTVLGRELFLRTYTHWDPGDVECLLVYVTPDCTVEMIHGRDFAVTYGSHVETLLLNTA